MIVLLLLYIVAMLYVLERIIVPLARLGEARRTADYRLAWSCGRNPHDPRLVRPA